jgi:hypothetical protein
MPVASRKFFAAYCLNFRELFNSPYAVSPQSTRHSSSVLREEHRENPLKISPGGAQAPRPGQVCALRGEDTLPA